MRENKDLIPYKIRKWSLKDDNFINVFQFIQNQPDVRKAPLQKFFYDVSPELFELLVSSPKTILKEDSTALDDTKVLNTFRCYSSLYNKKQEFFVKIYKENNLTGYFSIDISLIIPQLSCDPKNNVFKLIKCKQHKNKKSALKNKKEKFKKKKIKPNFFYIARLDQSHREHPNTQDDIALKTHMHIYNHNQPKSHGKLSLSPPAISLEKFDNISDGLNFFINHFNIQKDEEMNKFLSSLSNQAENRKNREK